MVKHPDRILGQEKLRNTQREVAFQLHQTSSITPIYPPGALEPRRDSGVIEVDRSSPETGVKVAGKSFRILIRFNSCFLLGERIFKGNSGAWQRVGENLFLRVIF